MDSSDVLDLRISGEFPEDELSDFGPQLLTDIMMRKRPNPKNMNKLSLENLYLHNLQKNI